MSILYFKTLPKNYKENNDVLLCGIDISGIQKYIFNVTDNKKSLQNIKKRSQTIELLTEYIKVMIEDQFQVTKEQLVSYTSGKYYFFTSRNHHEVLSKLFIDLQKDVYLSFKGELMLYFGLIDVLLSQSNPNREESAYRDLMHAIQLNKRQSYILLSYNQQTPFHNIKRIVEEKVQFKEELIEKLQDDSKHDYVVGLKMDLDNLGSFFGRLNQTDVILEVGAKIQQYITKTIDQFQNDTYQIFIGGDDIFILTKFSKMFTVSNLIQSKLRQAFKEIEHFGYIFSISSSAVVFKPKTPIIYYGEMLEQELGLAKTVKDAIVFEHHIFKWDKFKEIEDYIATMSKKLSNHHQFSSKLNNIEHTIKAIVSHSDKMSIIQNFILKIPQFQERMQVVPQTLMQYKPSEKEAYLNDIYAFLISLKYINRTINKGESYGY